MLISTSFQGAGSHAEQYPGHTLHPSLSSAQCHIWPSQQTEQIFCSSHGCPKHYDKQYRVISVPPLTTAHSIFLDVYLEIL